MSEEVFLGSTLQFLSRWPAHVNGSLALDRAYPLLCLLILHAVFIKLEQLVLKGFVLLFGI